MRIVAGLALLAAIPLAASPLNWIGLIGIVPLVTGLLGYCPLYSLIGMRTCPAEARAK